VSLDNHNLKGYVLPSIIFSFITIALVVAYKFLQYTSLWTNWKAAENNALTFCEHNRVTEAIVQPANTWSNFGFLMVGLLLVFIGINDLKIRKPSSNNLLVRYPGFSILLGASCIYLFFGSFLYHASLSYFFQKLDITGMYAVVLSLIAYNLFRLFPTRYAKLKKNYASNHHVIIVAAVLFNLVFFAGLWKVNVNVLFPAAIIVLMIINIFYNRSQGQFSKLYRYLFHLSIIVLLFSTTLWILDRQDIWCIPTSIWQGHALWHILNATSIFILYMCYRTETLDVELLYKDKEHLYHNFK